MFPEWSDPQLEFRVLQNEVDCNLEIRLRLSTG